jgi:flavin reductase (DIM6/NTAB) family NADH-FMN oxidoreductase RutF
VRPVFRRSYVDDRHFWLGPSGKVDCEVSSDHFRGAMRHLAGGVSVITVGRGRDITGMTVTSVSSLSVDPPTLISASTGNRRLGRCSGATAFLV